MNSKIKPMKKRGQGAIEFIIIFAVVLVFFVTFFGIIQQQQNNKDKEKRERLFLRGKSPKDMKNSNGEQYLNLLKK